MENRKIRRAALGRVAAVGALYNAYNDTFVGRSALSKPAPSSSVVLTDDTSTEIKVTILDSYSEKFDKLNVDPELKLSIVSGMVGLEGTGKFFEEDRRKAKNIVRGTLLHTIRTKLEQLDVSGEEVVGSISSEALENPEVTHVVVQVSWGAQAFITFEYHNDDNEDDDCIKEELKSALEKFEVAPSGGARIEFSDDDQERLAGCSLKIFGDFSDMPGALPQVFTEVPHFLKKLPKYSLTANGGKGVPLAYEMIPVSSLKGSKRETAEVFNALEEKTVVDLVKIFEDIDLAKLGIDSFYSAMMVHEDCLTEDELNSIRKMKEQVDRDKVSLPQELAQILVGFRAGTKDIHVVNDFISKMEKDELYARSEAIQGLVELVRNKLELCDVLRDNEAIYVPMNRLVDKFVAKNEQVYVLYAADERNTMLKMTTSEYTGMWRENFLCFIEKANHYMGLRDGPVNPGPTPVCLFAPHLAVKEGISVYHYRGGSVECTDVVQAQQQASVYARTPELIGTVSIDKSISGVTCLGDELFVLFYTGVPGSHELAVYDLDTFTQQRVLPLPGINAPTDMAGNKHVNAVFITDPFPRRAVFRVDRNGSISEWSVGEKLYQAGLSITPAGNILVTFENTKLQEFTPDGDLVKKYPLLGQDGSNLFHAVQLGSGDCVVATRGPMYPTDDQGRRVSPKQQVLVINGSGETIHSYGDQRGDSPGQLATPMHLAVDQRGFTLVADRHRCRVLVLSPSLEYVRELIPPESGVKGPEKIFLDEERGRLYLGDDEDHKVYIFKIKD